MLRITADVHDELVAHAIRQRPIEACGLLSARGGSDLADGFHSATNLAESATEFRLDPQHMLDIEREAEAAGHEIVAVMHSHLSTSPYPSPTDVADSARYDPQGHFRQVIVSLRHAEPSVRCFRIVDGTVTEELLVVDEPEPDIHDGAGAIAAVARLPRRP